LPVNAADQVGSGLQGSGGGDNLSLVEATVRRTSVDGKPHLDHMEKLVIWSAARAKAERARVSGGDGVGPG
jgi:hypothetical protein